MINLENCSKFEVFDFVKAHLLAQGSKCVNSEGKCRYRSGDLKCAAGCLIPDSVYDESMEGKSWDFLVGNGRVPKNHRYLISRLQRVHDCTAPDAWPGMLEEIRKTL